MNEDIHECYLEAGKIASKVMKQVLPKITESLSLLEIAEFAENKIRELGGQPAFPCNISINEVASHYTPENSNRIFRKGDVVKLDIGVHIDGYIADTATTIEIATCYHRRLIQATEEALDNAISSIKNEIQTRTIGAIIENTIKKYGFNPIKDLTGHSLEKYRLHAGITIPNYAGLFSQKIKKDMVFAIEPFATSGKGSIEYGDAYIFAYKKRKFARDPKIMDRFNDLPFARRWIPEINIENLKGIQKYREMIESSHNIVAQSEHTVIVNDDGCEVITR